MKNALFASIAVFAIVVSMLKFVEGSGSKPNQSDKASANSNLANTLYALPFKGESLEPGERVFTGDHSGGNQAEGEDFGVKRYLGDQKWSYLKDGTDGSKNSDHLIYGKPVYAMGEGVITGCWCNAPENPKPGETHPERATKRIPGGGNFLKVKHADGTIGLYAHMIPGSIPDNLCPNKAKLLPEPASDDNPSSNYVDLPLDKQIKIKKGQFLGRAGNSGRSSGPHLHVHMTEDGKAAKIYFEKGLYKKYENADLNDWISFSGQQIPDGRVLIWPPSTVTREYTRGGYPDEDFQRLFDHLNNSGYEPEWIDGYSVGNQAFFNFSWRPAKGKAWKAYFGLNSSDYQEKFDNRGSLTPIFVDSYTIQGEVRYNVIFDDAPGDFLARHGLSYKDHEQCIEAAKQRGLSPVNISVVSVNNDTRYTVLYRQKNYGQWSIRSLIEESDYQKEFNEFNAQGLTPVYLNGYKHKGTTYYSVVFAEKGGGSLFARHNLSAASLQTEFDKAMSNGYNTMMITAFDGAEREHRFGALWRK